jgi:septum formation protein
MTQVVLASASPRRRELLQLLLASFECCPVHIDETPLEGERPAIYVERLAREKSLACPSDDALVLAADTTVTLDGVILGKPDNRADARNILRTLSGREHEVLTAVAARYEGRLETVVVTTRVEFAVLDEPLIERYLDTHEPWDKAGAYGIQGYAGSFVRQISGNYSAVVGLPLLEVRELLAGFSVLPEWPVVEDG